MAPQLRIRAPKVAETARILVVEDDPAERLLVGLVLDDLGLAVDAAADGRAAIEMTARPDLILLDYMLPGDDGEVVAAALRERWGNVPILLMSAATNLEDKARRVGAVGRIDKPFDVGTLEAKVSKALSIAGLTARY